jgi:hypothetical protein
MILSIDSEKAFDKTQHPFMIKSSEETKNRKNVLQHNKGYKQKPRANIILNGEQLKLFPLKSGMSQGCPFSPLLFNIVLEFLTRAIRQQKEIKGIQIGQKKSK